MVDPNKGIKGAVSGLTGEEKAATIQTNPLERLTTQYTEFFRQRQEFIKAGYVDDYQELSKAFDGAFKKSFELFGNIEKGKLALDALRSSVTTFVFAGKDFQESLAQNITKMQGLGFEATTLSEIVDNSVMGFGKNKEQIDEVMGDLVVLQKELRLPASQLATDFKKAQETFAYNTEQFKQNFTELQRLSKQTGLSFDTLTGAFGRSMDTFQGSSEMAGRLNQILGRSAFNSIDLLNMTEAQRAQSIRQQFQGRDPNEMGKFELLAVTEALGLGSVQATRRFLSTGQMGAADTADDTGRNKMREEVSETISTGSKAASSALQGVADSIRKGQTPIERGLIQLGETLSIAGKKLTEGAIEVFLKELDPNATMSNQTKEAIAGLTVSQLQQLKNMLIVDTDFRKQFVDQIAPGPNAQTAVTKEDLVNMITAREGKIDISSEEFAQFAKKIEETTIKNQDDLLALTARILAMEGTSKLVTAVSAKLGVNEQTARLLAAQQAAGSKALDLIEAKVRGDEQKAEQLARDIEKSENIIDQSLGQVVSKITRMSNHLGKISKALGL